MILPSIHNEPFKWLSAIPSGLIQPGEVHVWRAFPGQKPFPCESLSHILSADELERAGRFRFEKDRNRFIAARGMLRQILGSYLGMKPEKIRFGYSAQGKPFLAENYANGNLSFNLSHTGDCAVYVLTAGRKIGIDIEWIREDRATEQIALNFFSPGEIRSLQQTARVKRTGLFFQYWTRKEAILKAMGTGFSYPLEKCDVSTISDGAMGSVLLPGEKGESSQWYVRDLYAGEGFAAAIAVEGDDWRLSCWDYGGDKA